MRAPRIASLAVAVVAVVLAATGAAAAAAAYQDGVIAAFRGKLILSNGLVPGDGPDKDVTARLKEAQLKEVVGKATDDGMVWRFSYAAFLTKTGSLALKMRFVSGEADRRQIAEDGVPIADPANPVLRGQLSINERQGLARGKAYVVQIVNDKGDVLAKTSAVFK